MNCWRVENLVAPFVDGDLPDAEADAVATHLELCPACAALVAKVDALPDFAPLPVDATVQQELMDALTRQVQERILAPPAAEPRAARAGHSGEGFLWALVRGELQVPAVLAGAYVALVVLLAGGIALNYQRVEALEQSLAERDQLIQTLSTRLAASEASVLNPFEVATSPELVFRQATAPATAGLGPSLVLQPSSRLGIQPVPVGRSALPYRLISSDSPRVVH